MKYGQGPPPEGGWKKRMVEDPTEYSPEFQDEYRRLWHESEEARSDMAAFIGHKGLGDEFLDWAIARRAEIDRLLAVPAAGDPT